MSNSSATCRSCSRSCSGISRCSWRCPGRARASASDCSRCSSSRPMDLRYLERFGAPGVMAQWWRGLAEWIGPPAVYLNNRGLIMPRAIFGEGSRIVAAAFVIAILAVIGLRAWARRRQEATGAALSGVVDLAGAADRVARARDARDRLAGELRGAGAARLQFRGRHGRDPGIHRAPGGAHDLHRRLHRRGRSRRRPRGAEGADRGGDGARPAAQDRRCA